MNKKEIDTKIKEIKKDFYAYRNGIVAEAIRKNYPVGQIIYGLNLPQFSEIAKNYPKSKDLGSTLWNDKKVRESRILSLYIIPPSEIEYDEAVSMILDTSNTEEAEILAFKILRYLPYADRLYNDEKNKVESESVPAYCLGMLKKNLDSLKTEK